MWPSGKTTTMLSVTEKDERDEQGRETRGFTNHMMGQSVHRDGRGGGLRRVEC